MTPRDDLVQQMAEAYLNYEGNDAEVMGRVQSAMQAALSVVLSSEVMDEVVDALTFYITEGQFDGRAKSALAQLEALRGEK